jgi:hypothetical protein
MTVTFSTGCDETETSSAATAASGKQEPPAREKPESTPHAQERPEDENASASPDPSADPEPDATDRSRPREGGEPSKEPCRDLAAKVRDACRSQLASGTDLGCASAYQGLATAADQADGKLFEVGSDAGNRKAADAQCRAFLGRLEKKLAEAGEPAAVSWGAQCKAYVASIDARCLAGLDEGRVGEDCMSRFVAARRVLTNDPTAAETACEMLNAAGG